MMGRRLVLTKRSWVPLAIIALVMVPALAALLQPAMANHFGYALPGPRGQPYRLTYAGRSYANPCTCAGAGWCVRTDGRACYGFLELPLSDWNVSVLVDVSAVPDGAWSCCDADGGAGHSWLPSPSAPPRPTVRSSVWI